MRAGRDVSACMSKRRCPWLDHTRGTCAAACWQRSRQASRRRRPHDGSRSGGPRCIAGRRCIMVPGETASRFAPGPSRLGAAAHVAPQQAGCRAGHGRFARPQGAANQGAARCLALCLPLPARLLARSEPNRAPARVTVKSTLRRIAARTAVSCRLRLHIASVRNAGWRCSAIQAPSSAAITSFTPGSALIWSRNACTAG